MMMLAKPTRSKQALAAEREWAGQARARNAPQAQTSARGAGLKKIWLLVALLVLVAPKLIRYF